jgi:hypothetical protein
MLAIRKNMEFGSEIIEEIKSYVYIYSDPDTQEPFYIGKGQSNRCFQHIEDQSESAKIKKLIELEKNNKKPLIELLRYGLTDSEASLLEAALIDFVGLDNLTNKVRGLHSRSRGRIFVEDIILKYTATDAIINDKALLITINKLYHSRMSEEELYEATQGVWKGKEKRLKEVKFAFAVFQGIVREVYEISRWHPAGTLSYKYRDASSFGGLKRWEFEGEKASEDIRNKYVKRKPKPNKIYKLLTNQSSGFFKRAKNSHV